MKGPQYITQVQQQSRPTLNLDEAMSSEPVQKALSMGGYFLINIYFKVGSTIAYSHHLDWR